MEALLKEKDMLAATGTSTQQTIQQTIAMTSTERVETSTKYSSEKLIKDLGDLSLTNQENEILLASLRRMEENGGK